MGGTKTMHEALKILGYSVYDYPENYWYLYDNWMKIFLEGGTEEDFKGMYENVDAVMDVPCCHYWEEIHEAFPDSKIIFTSRESEDIWYKSFVKQMTENQTWIIQFLCTFSYHARRLLEYGYRLSVAVMGQEHKLSFFRNTPLNELALRMWYRRHNAYVLAKAPKNKTLQYNVKEGWGPLCEFLGVPVPDVKFPHKNKGGEIMKEMLETHPLFVRIGREAMFSFGVLVAGMGYCVYSVATNPLEASVLGLPRKCLDAVAQYFGYQAI